MRAHVIRLGTILIDKSLFYIFSQAPIDLTPLLEREIFMLSPFDTTTRIAMRQWYESRYSVGK